MHLFFDRKEIFTGTYLTDKNKVNCYISPHKSMWNMAIRMVILTDIYDG